MKVKCPLCDKGFSFNPDEGRNIKAAGVGRPAEISAERTIRCPHCGKAITVTLPPNR